MIRVTRNVIGKKVLCTNPQNGDFCDNHHHNNLFLRGVALQTKGDSSVLVGVTFPLDFYGHDGLCHGDMYRETNWHDKCWYVDCSLVSLVSE